MKILIIDPHGTKIHEGTTNVHARNSLVLSQYLNADLMYDEETQTEEFSGNKYDAVVFVHTSGYVQVKKLLEYLSTVGNPKYFYITNEYNLGDPVTLYSLCKNNGVEYEVIANYPQSIMPPFILSKDSISKWNNVNLNSLIYKKIPKIVELFEPKKSGIIYYGTFRKDRAVYFEKYFDKRIYVSTSRKNTEKYRAAGLDASFVGALQWSGKKRRIDNFKASLYLEDVTTHSNYNYLANRFYEALSFSVPCVFDESCCNTIRLSKYPISSDFIINSKQELHELAEAIPEDFEYSEEIHAMAEFEKTETLKQIEEIVCR